MQEVHELVGAHLEFEDDLVDAGDEEVVEEVADDADDEAADGGHHGGVDARGEHLDVDVVAGMGHLLEGGDHAHHGAKEADHGAEGCHGGHEGDAAFEVGHLELALVLDGSLDVGQRTAEAREALVDHAAQGGVGLLGEVAGLVDVALVDIFADVLHEDVVFLALEGGAEGEVALDEDVDGQHQQQGQHQHNPTAADGHIPNGDVLGLFGGVGNGFDGSLRCGRVALDQ